jgi:hypothetical protein
MRSRSPTSGARVTRKALAGTAAMGGLSAAAQLVASRIKLAAAGIALSPWWRLGLLLANGESPIRASRANFG